VTESHNDTGKQVSRDHDEVLQRDVHVSVLPAKGLRVVLDATEEERQILATRANVLSVERFTCEMLFKRWHKKGVSVTGEVSAQLTQECVISLEPLAASVVEEIDRTFVPEGSKLARPHINGEGEIVVDYESPDEPEPFSGDTLNAWDIALEHFLLGIEPFPRKPGAELSGAAIVGEGEVSVEAENPGPFAGLKDLLKSKK